MAQTRQLTTAVIDELDTFIKELSKSINTYIEDTADARKHTRFIFYKQATEFTLSSLQTRLEDQKNIAKPYLTLDFDADDEDEEISNNPYIILKQALLEQNKGVEIDKKQATEVLKKGYDMYIGMLDELITKIKDFKPHSKTTNDEDEMWGTSTFLKNYNATMTSLATTISNLATTCKQNYELADRECFGLNIMHLSLLIELSTLFSEEYNKVCDFESLL